MKVIGPKLVLATHNKGKLREIADLVARFGIEVVGAEEAGLPEPEETGVTFIDNAELKARQAADLSGLPALADDSGLCVEALNGDPGVRSARWAEDEDGNRDFYRAMEKVEAALQLLGEDVSRDAHFTCALSLAWPDGRTETFEGKVHGQMVWPPRGENGFGYDPVFMATGEDITFGEMEPAKKHAMSHRADAFRQLLAWLEAQDA
ncbi:RdgB/HAM1 family non-canonical purine NTP pyrophosphatase [Sphingomicrobium aestuariivivum]|uniref:RdgB/HAM1 family non-canonical purine NTP pyrophosphatase n=1 Tax=Sphingomicrobium aestuariivivum TaxID=1582356 RepID=UPI001FD6A081|nr:RdgB/HAM1 family non-canonical purine NTP pyrophosphatase [Sphingomicrobium aestuariivivum]MCJ8190255.1 RdgB/HAM1 family non-canonical purine NTP pyrophosphatase [Sphingomicrobium aestuariivivum]